MSNLSSENIYKIIEDKCRKHGVSFDYCYTRLGWFHFEDGIGLVEAIDKLLVWAYFNDFYSLYKGIIPYRECMTVEAAIAILEEMELEDAARKPGSTN